MSEDLKPLINIALKQFIDKSLKTHKIRRAGKLLSACIREFILRDGKRVRPIFFLLAYRGYARKRISADVLETSLAFELLHDFLLVHDDIIDNSPTRRGRPTVHKIIAKELRIPEKIGQDLAIVAGDIIYAMAIEAFLSIKTAQALKETALKEFLRATMLTGAGEYKDVTNGFLSLEKTTLNDIRLNYLLKTAEYTFRAPIICGAIVSGAPRKDLRLLSDYALMLGEAFQIHDDVIGIFGNSQKIGKSVLSDILEAKKTLPVYWAFKKGTSEDRKFLARSLGNPKVTFRDLQRIREIINNSGAMLTTTETVNRLLRRAREKLDQTSMDSNVKCFFEQSMRKFIQS